MSLFAADSVRSRRRRTPSAGADVILTGRCRRRTIDLVRSAFQSFSAEDIDAALSFCSPDVVWYTTDRWLDGSAYRGYDGMRSLAAALPGHLDDFRFEVHEIRDAPDRVVACVDMVGSLVSELA